MVSVACVLLVLLQSGVKIVVCNTVCLLFINVFRFRSWMHYGWKEKQYQKLNQLKFRKSYKKNMTCNNLCLPRLHMPSNFFILFHYYKKNTETILVVHSMVNKFGEVVMLPPQIWFSAMAIADLNYHVQFGNLWFRFGIYLSEIVLLYGFETPEGWFSPGVRRLETELLQKELKLLMWGLNLSIRFQA